MPDSNTFIRPPSPELPPLTSWPSVPTPVPNRRRILVIEDNQDAAETLALLLDLSGHEAKLAHTGPDGLRLALEWVPDVVLCDIGLPGLNGYGVARELRAQLATRDMLLVALTAFSREEDRQEALSAGFDFHVTKPADPDKLLRLLYGGG
jgi:CheY-like chemotaxis protein